MKTIAISPKSFIMHGCPCCCTFNIRFNDVIFNTRIATCKKTERTFHIVCEGQKSDVGGSLGETVEVIEHPMGQLVS